MREFLETLANRDILCPKIEEIDLKSIGSRKRLKVYRGVERDGYFCMAIILDRKSRVLQKEAKEFIELHKRLEEKLECVIKRKYLLIKAPLCSKAKKLLIESRWRIFPLEG